MDGPPVYSCPFVQAISTLGSSTYHSLSEFYTGNFVPAPLEYPAVDSPSRCIPDHTKTHAPSRSNAFTESNHVWDSSDKHREHAGVHIGHDQNFIN